MGVNYSKLISSLSLGHLPVFLSSCELVFLSECKFGLFTASKNKANSLQMGLELGLSLAFLLSIRIRGATNIFVSANHICAPNIFSARVCDFGQIFG